MIKNESEIGEYALRGKSAVRNRGKDEDTGKTER